MYWLLLLGVVGCAAEPPPPPTCVQTARSRSPARPGEPSGPQATLESLSLQVGDQTVVAEVADSPDERAAGLMFRDALAAGQGMLFVYPRPKPLSFWMRNTCLPLSIAYINDAGNIVAIADMTPLNEAPVPSHKAALYALEVPQGWFDDHNIVVGQRVVGLPAPSAQ